MFQVEQWESEMKVKAMLHCKFRGIKTHKISEHCSVEIIIGGPWAEPAQRPCRSAPASAAFLRHSTAPTRTEALQRAECEPCRGRCVSLAWASTLRALSAVPP